MTTTAPRTKRESTTTTTPEPAVAGSMPVDGITVIPGYNVRQDLGDIDELAASIKLLGVLQPIIVATGGVLIDRHRRLAAAKKAGLAEIPVLITDELGDEAIAAASNIARTQFSPAEEAEAIKRMLDAGYTPDGAAKALGLSKNKVTRRLELLELPTAARELYRSDGAKQDTIPAVKTLTGKVPALTELVVAAQALTGGMDEKWDRVDVRYLADDPAEYIGALRSLTGLDPSSRNRGFGRKPEKLDGMPDWPDGLVVVDVDSREGINLNDPNLGLSAEIVKSALELQEKAAKLYIYDRQVTFSDSDLDAARAAGVLIELEGLDGRDCRLVADKGWLRDWLESTVLPLYIGKLKGRIRVQETQNAKRRGGSAPSAGGAEPTAAEKKAIAAAERRRAKEKEWAGLAPGANLDLGRELLTQLGSVEVTKDVALFFAETSLGQRPGPGRYNDDRPMLLAAGGLRYVMPGWQEEKPIPTKADPKRTKTVYLEPAEAEKKLWEWFDRAGTPGEILGRAIVIHAAARWAVENHLAQSNRMLADHGQSIINSYRPRYVVVPKGPGQTALERIVEPVLPQTVKDLIADIQKSGGR